MTTGERIKKRREMLNLSVDVVAEQLGKNRATVYRYENGYIDDIPVSIISKLSDILLTSPAYLMGWTDDPNQTAFHEQRVYKKETIDNLSLFVSQFELIAHLLRINLVSDKCGGVAMENLHGDTLDCSLANQIDLLRVLTASADNFIKNKDNAICDLYDRLDEHGRAIVDTVIQLELQRMDGDQVRT